MKEKSRKLRSLPTLAPIPEGLTQHPYTLLATISAQLINLESHFSPEAYKYIRDAISKILTGTDPIKALRLNIRKTNESANLRNICMVYEIIDRNASEETLDAIYTDLSENGYEWQDKKYSLTYANIKKIYEKLSPIIFHNRGQ